MVTYVLDSSALLRFLDDEAGAQRVSAIVKDHLAGRCELAISSLHWGEIAGVTAKLHGDQAMDLVLSRLSAFGLQIIPANAERAVHAALIKLKHGLPYVDAFGVELVAEIENGILITADFDFKPASRDVKIEFLPAK